MSPPPSRRRSLDTPYQTAVAGSTSRGGISSARSRRVRAGALRVLVVLSRSCLSGSLISLTGAGADRPDLVEPYKATGRSAACPRSSAPTPSGVDTDRAPPVQSAHFPGFATEVGRTDERPHQGPYPGRDDRSTGAERHLLGVVVHL